MSKPTNEEIVSECQLSREEKRALCYHLGLKITEKDRRWVDHISGSSFSHHLQTAFTKFIAKKHKLMAGK